MKELKSLRGISQPRKIPGRKTIEVIGPEDTLWQLMYKSRIAEDIQVRITQPFMARGEKELETKLAKMPWHCYLPDPKKHSDLQFKMPQTRAKTYMSKLFHTQLVRDILIEAITETQIRKEFKISMLETGITSYKHFKKEWLAKKVAQEKKEVEKLTKQKLGRSVDVEEEEEVVVKESRIKGLDEVRAELQAQKDFMKGLKELSKVSVNIVKDQAEVLLSTSHEDLHMHGYKPFMRWGVLKETLTAACILESGILQKANHTGKLYLWDPFCGSGSFLIETIMMLLDQPVRNFSDSHQMPFEFWPVHQKEAYEQFRIELNDFQKMHKRHEIDVQIIGSDISQKAIEATCKNIEYAEIQQLIEHDLLEVRSHRFINNPLVLSQHWPKPYTKASDQESAEGGLVTTSSQLINFKDTERNLAMSVYHGDFQDVGHKLAHVTDQFKDFSIITNVPYGIQSHIKQRQTDTDLHHLYRRFGRFLRLYPNLEFNTYVVAQAHHYGHKLSFEKFSNCGWSKEIAFKNGGIGVHLLKYDMSQISEVKQTMKAYEELAAMPPSPTEMLEQQ